MRFRKSTAFLRGKFIARQANIKKKEKHQIKKKKKTDHTPNEIRKRRTTKT